MVKEDWMVPSQRPTTVNRPVLEKQSEALQTALKTGTPYASGVSGSTNIALHALNSLNSKNGDNIDKNDFLLGTMMFLVYDGGHSMHEALWTANQLDSPLHLGYGLSAPDQKPNEFVADYEKFQSMYKGNSTGQALGQASSTAFENLTNYFNKHSHYSAEK